MLAQCDSNEALNDYSSAHAHTHTHTHTPANGKGQQVFGTQNSSGQSSLTKISPVQDWRSTPLEWLKSTCDLDLDIGRTIRHTVAHHSSTSIYTPNFIEIEKKTFCRRTYVRTNGRRGRTFQTLSNVLFLGRLERVDLKGRIAATYERFSHVRQVASMCILI